MSTTNAYNEVVKTMVDIYELGAAFLLKSAIPSPFKIEIKKGLNAYGEFVDIKIYINDEEIWEQIVVFEGEWNRYNYEGNFLEGFDWAKDALSGFFSSFPSLREEAKKIWDYEQKKKDEVRNRTKKEKSERAEQIYLTALANKERAP